MHWTGCGPRSSGWSRPIRSDQALRGHVLISQRLYAEVEDDVEVEQVGELALAGFQRPVAAFNVVALRAADRSAEGG